MKTIESFKIFLFVCLISISCSRQVIRQSVLEIDRPLFIPQKNWQASAGIELFRFVNGSEHDDTTGRAPYMKGEILWSPVLNLQWPSIHISDKVELNPPA
jgi:hypothetical protein